MSALSFLSLGSLQILGLRSMRKLPQVSFPCATPRHRPPCTEHVFVIGLTVVLGYFTTGHRMTEEELAAVKGRSWEEWVHSHPHSRHLSQRDSLTS